MSDPSHLPPSGVRRGFPRVLRWCRRGAWVVLAAALALTALFSYINQVGLPNALKGPLIADLQSRGIQLQFKRLRLRLTRGLVVEDVRLSPAAGAWFPDIQARDVQIQIGWRGLLAGRLVPKGFKIGGGALSLPLPASNAPPARVRVDDIEGWLVRFNQDDWRLQYLDGRCLGAAFHLETTITNISAWQPRRQRTDSGRTWIETAARIVHALESIPMEKDARITARCFADVRHPEHSRLELDVRLPATGYSGWQVGQASVAVRCEPSSNAGAELQATVEAEFDNVVRDSVRMDHARIASRSRISVASLAPDDVSSEVRVTGLGAPGGLAARNAELQLRTTGLARPSLAGLETTWKGSLTDVESGVVHARTASVSGNARHSWTNWSRLGASVLASAVDSRWGQAEDFVFQFDLRPAAVPGAEALRALGTNPAWIEGGASLQVTNARAQGVAMESIHTRLRWAHPWLVVESLNARGDDGWIAATGRWDRVSGLVTAGLNARYDAQRIAPLLATNSRRWIAQYSWPHQAPPDVSASARVILPPSKVAGPEWAAQLLDSLELDGRVDAAAVGYRGLAARRVEGRFTCTNRVWRLPGMRIEHEDGLARFVYRNDERTHAYHYDLDALIHPKAVRPLLSVDEAARMDRHVKFGAPIRIQGEVWGNYHDPGSIIAAGQLWVTNIAVRGEAADEASGRFALTNRVLTLSGVRIRAGTELLTAHRVVYDMDEQSLTFTDTRGAMDIGRVTRAIGPKTARALLPYRFSKPPKVVLNGVLPTRGDTPMNARFEVEASGFDWWRFHTTNTTGIVLAGTNSVTVSNLVAGFYGGQAAGDIWVDTAPPEGSIARFTLGFTNTEVRPLMADLGFRTNRVDGRISGRLNIDSSLSWDPDSWFGHGHVTLTNGFLWDYPLFGVFTPVMDSISPGWGQSRFTRGDAHFRVTNSVIRTADMVVYSPSMALRYDGLVDLQGRLDATMEARLTSQTPLFGPILSMAFFPVAKLMEYKVTGTLANPEIRPLYVPRFLLAPLHPLRTIRDLFGPDRSPPRGTNTPAPPN